MKRDELIDFFSHIASLPGTSGYEQPVAEAIRDAFAPFCNEAHVDGMGSVIARQRGAGPKVMLCAHLDEISMATLTVEDDGAVRFLPMGMANVILPAHEVYLLTEEGPLFGVIGAKPARLREGGGKEIKAEELFIDTGLPAQEVKRLVPAGTPVQLAGPTVRLQNGRFAGKTLDDRACVAILYACAREMASRLHHADVIYALTSQEEYGSLGALTGAHAVRPDMAIVLDATFARQEGVKPEDAFPLDASTLAVGPNLHRGLTARIREEAERLGMKLETEVIGGATGTDAWVVQTACEGIPCALLSLPVRHMHTSVELGSADVMLAQAHLLAQTLCGIEAGWEETLCF